MAIIRFRDLVKTAGKPEPKTLWTEPKNDREFSRAIKQNRVLTVVQESAKKDFGEMGFHQQQGALYFVFPKRLPMRRGKVIGIKYDLAESREPKDPVSAEDLKRVSKHAKVRVPEKLPPATKTFNVSIRRVATTETNVLVEARSKAEARKKSIEMVKGMEFDASKSEIENHIQSVK